MTVLKLMPESVECAGWCGRLLHPWERHNHPGRSDVPGPHVYARGMCSRCYRGAERAGVFRTRPQARRTPRMVPRDLLLTEFELLAGDGVPVREMPARIGMGRDAFMKALYRARLAGDPRVAGSGRAA